MKINAKVIYLFIGITKEESKFQAYDILRTHNQDIDAHEPFYEKIKKFIKEQHFAPIDSPKFNGIPEVPLPSSYDSDNQVVNVALLKSKLGTLDLGIMDGDVSNEKAWWVKIGGKIPLIIQGGRGYSTVELPIAFSNRCLTVVGVDYGTTGEVGGDIIDKSTVHIYSSDDHHYDMMYVAFGY